MIKGIEKLVFLTSDDKKLLQKSEQLYKQHARIEFEILSISEGDNDPPEIIIKVWQDENQAEKYLSADELVKRTKDVFNMIPAYIRVHVRPIPYGRNKLLNYNIEDVRADMEKFGLQQKDLVKLLDIDKASINILLNGGRELTKYQKAMFYYFFEYLRANI